MNGQLSPSSSLNRRRNDFPDVIQYQQARADSVIGSANLCKGFSVAESQALSQLELSKLQNYSMLDKDSQAQFMER